MNQSNIDEGLEFIQKLGFAPVDSFDDFKVQIKEQLGPEFLQEFIRILDTRYENKGKCLDIYSLKNNDMYTAMTFSGLYEGNYYRDAINYFASQSNHIKGKVLDVGSDNGVITCYLANRFPECTFIGIEREPSSVKIAQQLASKLGLNNISFVVTDIKQFKADDQFDTITSSRTVTENNKDVVEPGLYGYTKTLRENSVEYRDSMIDYVNCIGTYLKPDGKIVQCERLANNQMYCGYLMAANQCQFTQVEETYFFQSNEGGMTGRFAGMVFKKEPPTISEEDIFLSWRSNIVKKAQYCTGYPERCYVGLDAQAFLESCGFKQKAGYIFSDASLGRYHNTSYALGTCDVKLKKYLKYTISDFESSDEGREQKLTFLNNEGFANELKNQQKILNDAKRRGWKIQNHYFGD